MGTLAVTAPNAAGEEEEEDKDSHVLLHVQQSQS
jgi:hypothetical protein